MIQTPDIQALNRWARRNGYHDFDTYIATGGNLLSAAESLIAERSDINRALAAINRYSPIPEPLAEREAPQGVELTAAHELPPLVEPVPQPYAGARSAHNPAPDPDNAAVQGADA